MRLASVTLTNFRCFTNESVDFDNYTALVGANNAGKSTVFKALDVFFKSTQKSSPIALSDFRDPKAILKIALTFRDVPIAAQEVFAHYFRHGYLEFFIKSSVDEGGRIVSSIHGNRLGVKAFSKFYEANSAADKKSVYVELHDQYPSMPVLRPSSAVSVFEAALKEYETAHPDQTEMIESQDLAFGASGIATRLKKYVEWVYIPAVKDASDEDEEAKSNAFGTLVNRLIRARVNVDEKMEKIKVAANDQINDLIKDYKVEVDKLEIVLDDEFRRITSTDAHVHLSWSEFGPDNVALNPPIVRSILSDDTFKGEISRFGHGLQRNYLMTLVQLNAKLAAEFEPLIILACEEPELYQHPPQARYLYAAFQRLASADQVLVTTHSPFFVNARSFGSIRVVRKSRGGASKICAWTIDEHRSLIAAARAEDAIGALAAAATLENFIQPELGEAFFCTKLLLVEGAEDRALIMALLEQKAVLEDFIRLGGHVVAVGGKGNLINMIALARGFSADYAVVFDADTNCKDDQKANNLKQNELLLTLLQMEELERWPSENIFSERATIWSCNIQHAISKDCPDWLDRVRSTCSDWGWNYDRLDKNPAVLSFTLTKAMQDGVSIASLNNLADRIMSFARD